MIRVGYDDKDTQVSWNAFWKFSNWTLLPFWQEDIGDMEEATLCGRNIAVAIAVSIPEKILCWSLPMKYEIIFTRENQDQCDRRAVFLQGLWRHLRSISDLSFALTEIKRTYGSILIFI